MVIPNTPINGVHEQNKMDLIFALSEMLRESIKYLVDEKIINNPNKESKKGKLPLMEIN